MKTQSVYYLDHVNFFEDLFESITEYRKKVLLLVSIENDVVLSHESGFVKNDNSRLCTEFKKILLEKN